MRERIGDRKVSSTNGPETTVCPCGKINLTPPLPAYSIVNMRWTIDLNIILKSIHLLKGNLHNCGVRKDFLGKTQSVLTIKEQN